MNIYIQKNNQQQGPFTLQEVNAKLAAGEFRSEDPAWTEGWTDWQFVSDVPGTLCSPPPTPEAPEIPKPPQFGAPNMPTPIPVTPLPPFEPTATESKISWIPALVFYCIFIVVSLLIDLVGLDAFVLISLPFMVLGLVFISILHYKCWASLPERFRFTTPGKAVGYLFMPFYNFYWAFITWPKLSEGISNWQKSRGVSVHPDTQSFALAYAILFVCELTIGFLPLPGLSFMFNIADLAIFILYYKQVVTSINQLLSK